MIRTRLLILVILTAATAAYGCRGPFSCFRGNSEPAGEYKLRKKLETFSYVEGGTEQQKLDLYRLVGVSEPRPALVWIHGGGWIRGFRGNVDPIAFDMASIGGYQLISVGYRYANDETAPWPEIMYDVNGAIRWIKLHAGGLSVDPDEIILVGESAGAHLAALAATSSGVAALSGDENPGPSTEVSAVVLFFGPYNMARLAEGKRDQIEKKYCMKPGYRSPAQELLDCPNVNDGTYNVDGCKAEDIELADPGTHIDANDPPAYLAHGTGDCVVPWTESGELSKELTAAGVRNVLVRTPGGVHRINSLNVNAGEIVEFLEER